MAGGKHQAVMEDHKDPSRLFLLGDRVDAPIGRPDAVFSGVGYHSPQAGEPRSGADVLALEGGQGAEHQHYAFFGV